jgi:hypothetical protein
MRRGRDDRPKPRSPVRATLVFAAAVLAMAVVYDYPRVASLGPMSRHYWRQADGASLARCYFEQGMSFFEPQVHNVVGGDHHAVGEFPALYYAVAALYHLFGPGDGVFRVFNFVVLLTGLFLYFRLLLAQVDPCLALAPPLLLLGSALLAFYGFGFLPNTTALGLVLSAAFLYFRFIDTQRLGWFYGAAATAASAGLLKPSFVIAPLALFGAGILAQALIREERWSGHVPRWPHLLVAAGLVAGASAIWIAWARQYNEQHGSHLFLLDVKPFWDSTGEQVAATWRALSRWRRFYLHGPAFTVFASLSLLLLCLPRRVPIVAYLTLWLTLLGSGIFFALFFGQLAAHDYYLIDLMPLAALVFGLGSWVANGLVRNRTQRAILAVVLAVVVIAGVRHTDRVLDRFYAVGSKRMRPVLVRMNEKAALRSFLGERDLAYPDLAVVVGDPSPNSALYYLNLRGWVENRRLDAQDLERFAEAGAKALVVLDPGYLPDPATLARADAEPLGVFGDRIRFFALRAPGGRSREEPAPPSSRGSEELDRRHARGARAPR